MTKKPVIYYAHIPKTGGTSFTALLDRFYGVDEVFPAKVWPQVDEGHDKRNLSYRLFRGHFGGGGIKELTANEYSLITMLRRPIDLVLSTYHFVRRRQHIIGHELVNEKQMSLTDFLQHPQTRFLTDNRMTRFLSFGFQQDPSVQGVFLNQKAINRVLPMLNEAQFQITQDERFERAWDLVNKSYWFGLLERFDDSLRLLCYQMKWPPVRKTQKLNQSSQTKKISSADMALVEKLNQFDLRLYDKASELFDERFEKMSMALLRYQTDSTQTLDDLLDLHYQNEGNNSLQDAVDYSFEEPLKGSGWHRRQLVHNGIAHCRWTGPETISSIDFWLNHHDYELQIDVIHAISLDVLNDLTLSINNSKLTWKSNSKGIKRTLKAIISKDLIEPNGLTRLKLRLPATKPFCELDSSNDERKVGIAVVAIRLEVS